MRSEHIAVCLHCGARFRCGDAIPDVCRACELAGHQGTPFISGLHGEPPCPVCAAEHAVRKQEVAEDFKAATSTASVSRLEPDYW